MEIEQYRGILAHPVLSERLADIKSGQVHDGIQVVVRFKNSWGASVINHSGSYGVELAVIKFMSDAMDDFDLRYDTAVTGDVLGWLTPEGLQDALIKISALTPNGNLNIEE